MSIGLLSTSGNFWACRLEIEVPNAIVVIIDFFHGLFKMLEVKIINYV
jgi:hypothetical protein